MHCPCFPLLLTSGWRVDNFFLLLLIPSSPRRRHCDFVQRTCSSMCTGAHTADQLLLFHLHPLLFIFFFFQLGAANCTIAASYPPILVEPLLFYNQRPASDWPANCCLRPFCLFALIFLVTSDMVFILCCRFISSSPACFRPAVFTALSRHFFDFLNHPPSEALFPSSTLGTLEAPVPFAPFQLVTSYLQFSLSSSPLPCKHPPIVSSSRHPPTGLSHLLLRESSVWELSNFCLKPDSVPSS